MAGSRIRVARPHIPMQEEISKGLATLIFTPLPGLQQFIPFKSAARHPCLAHTNAGAFSAHPARQTQVLPVNKRAHCRRPARRHRSPSFRDPGHPSSRRFLCLPHLQQRKRTAFQCGVKVLHSAPIHRRTPRPSRRCVAHISLQIMRTSGALQGLHFRTGRQTNVLVVDGRRASFERGSRKVVALVHQLPHPAHPAVADEDLALVSLPLDLHAARLYVEWRQSRLQSWILHMSTIFQFWG